MNGSLNLLERCYSSEILLMSYHFLFIQRAHTIRIIAIGARTLWTNITDRILYHQGLFEDVYYMLYLYRTDTGNCARAIIHSYLHIKAFTIINNTHTQMHGECTEHRSIIGILELISLQDSLFCSGISSIFF